MFDNYGFKKTGPVILEPPSAYNYTFVRLHVTSAYVGTLSPLKQLCATRACVPFRNAASSVTGLEPRQVKTGSIMLTRVRYSLQ